MRAGESLRIPFIHTSRPLRLFIFHHTHKGTPRHRLDLNRRPHKTTSIISAYPPEDIIYRHATSALLTSIEETILHKRRSSLRVVLFDHLIFCILASVLLFVTFFSSHFALRYHHYYHLHCTAKERKTTNFYISTPSLFACFRLSCVCDACTFSKRSDSNKRSNTFYWRKSMSKRKKETWTWTREAKNRAWAAD